MNKLGDGSRFKATKKALAKRGAKNPAALAAWVGRKKYGNDRFAALSAAGREKAAARRASLVRIKV
jgi:hypothetical protein